jgi:hypothetical protein
MIEKKADSIKTGYIEYWKKFFIAEEFVVQSLQKEMPMLE